MNDEVPETDPWVEAHKLLDRLHAAMTPAQAWGYFLRLELRLQAVLYGQIDAAKAAVDAARRFADWREQHER